MFDYVPRPTAAFFMFRLKLVCLTRFAIRPRFAAVEL